MGEEIPALSQRSATRTGHPFLNRDPSTALICSRASKSVSLRMTYDRNMPIRSMTGFAQVKGQVNGQSGFTLSLKSVNHRFLDLHFRMPSDSDDLEMKLRRLLKEKMARGHVELTLNLERGASEGFSLNRALVGGYVQAFRAAAAEFGLAASRI